MKLSFYDYMRAGQVKRWHIVETTRQQTLAEHLWRTTVIALELYDQIVGAKFNGRESWHEILQLVMEGLFHDTPEIRMGDTPTPAKAFIRENAGDVFTPMQQALMPEIPYIGGTLPVTATMAGGDGILARILKLADAIEAAHWISEHKVGAHADVVAQANRKIMADLVVRYSQETELDWFAPANHVLMALGMPYLSVNLRLTPP